MVGMFSERGGNTEGKVKLLVTSNFSFSHSVFKRFVLQKRKKKGFFGKGLKGRYNLTLQQTKKMGQSELKAFADDNRNIAQITISVLDVERKHCCNRRKCLLRSKKGKCLLPTFPPFPEPYALAHQKFYYIPICKVLRKRHQY